MLREEEGDAELPQRQEKQFVAAARSGLDRDAGDDPLVERVARVEADKCTARVDAAFPADDGREADAVVPTPWSDLDRHTLRAGRADEIDAAAIGLRRELGPGPVPQQDGERRSDRKRREDDCR